MILFSLQPFTFPKEAIIIPPKSWEEIIILLTIGMCVRGVGTMEGHALTVEVWLHSLVVYSASARAQRGCEESA